MHWLLALLLFSGTVGVFQGRVVQPRDTRAEQGYIYVQGPNGWMRRVNIQEADIRIAEEVPKERQKGMQKKLRAGIKVQVTAEQLSDGEWKASKVEILPETPVPLHERKDRQERPAPRSP